MESILLISFGLINIHFVERIFINKKQYAITRFQTTFGKTYPQWCSGVAHSCFTVLLFS